MNQQPERWLADAGDAPEACLDIPADSQRERRFEIACSMTVRPAGDATAPWHELRVYADGDLQWSRRIPTQHPAAFDGLDYRFRRTVAVGRGLRLQALSECNQGRRIQLTIEADEC